MSKFSDLINKSDIPVLVDYYADWCGPCKHMESVLKSVAAKLEDKLRVIKVDVDKNQAVSQLYKIQSIPTMMLFYKGKVLWRQSGAMPEQVLLQHLTPHLTAKV
ncbi:MAG: thioredoxin [Bacteroidota bacterium]